MPGGDTHLARRDLPARRVTAAVLGAGAARLWDRTWAAGTVLARALSVANAFASITLTPLVPRLAAVVRRRRR